MIKTIIFDWGRTLYDPETQALFPETRKVLDCLHTNGIQLAIVALATAGLEKIAERQGIIDKEGIRYYFESIMFDIENKEVMYEKTFSELSLDPATTMIVDDRVIRGIAWGNKRECTTVWCRNGKFAKELPNENNVPTHTISNISELVNVLKYSSQ